MNVWSAVVIQIAQCRYVSSLVAYYIVELLLPMPV